MNLLELISFISNFQSNQNLTHNLKKELYEIINKLLSIDYKLCGKLFDKSAEIKKKYTNKKTYLRGLIEYSNICSKNCFYCGLRKENSNVIRYFLPKKEVIDAVLFAYQNGFGSVVIQGGEIQSPKHTKTISELLNKINAITNNELGITLSFGEQSKDTFKEWKKEGATRYLLRIETSSQKLYETLHPNDTKHSFNTRKKTIEEIKNLDYQLGTGIMIGIPGQTIQDLANDLLFMFELDVDMIGMGPYIEHSDTPLYQIKNEFSLNSRFELTLKMIAIIRILMKNVNIAATTALDTIDNSGKIKAIKIGANVIMPNITPINYREKYLLYENKKHQLVNKQYLYELNTLLQDFDSEIGFFEKGDPLHFKNKISI